MMISGHRVPTFKGTQAGRIIRTGKMLFNQVDCVRAFLVIKREHIARMNVFRLLSQNSDELGRFVDQWVEWKRSEMRSTPNQLPFVVPKRRQGRKRGARGNVYQETASFESASGYYVAIAHRFRGT